MDVSMGSAEETISGVRLKKKYEKSAVRGDADAKWNKHVEDLIYRSEVKYVKRELIIR